MRPAAEAPVQELEQSIAPAMEEKVASLEYGVVAWTWNRTLRCRPSSGEPAHGGCPAGAAPDVPGVIRSAHHARLRETDRNDQCARPRPLRVQPPTSVPRRPIQLPIRPCRS